MRASKYSDQQKKQMLKECEGLTNVEAAKKLGISASALYKWKEQLNIKKTTTSKAPKTTETPVKVNVSKKPKVNVKRAIAALNTITAQLNKIETVLKAVGE